MSDDKVCRVAAIWREAAKAYWVECFDGDMEEFEDKYVGWFAHVGEFVEMLVEEQVIGVPEHLIGYIDTRAYGRDMEINGEIYTDAFDGGVLVFWA